MGLYEIVKPFVRFYFKMFNRLEIIGSDYVPDRESVLLCSNHMSNMDPPLLGCASPRSVHFMAKSELFEAPILKHLLPRIHAFPVKRGKGDRQALKAGLKVLQQNRVMGFFPEGTRSKTGEIGRGHAGAGFFALRSEAVIVPCVIIGSYKPFHKLKIVFGEPVDMSDLRAAKSTAQLGTDRIMTHLQQLWEENNHSV